MYYLVKDDVGTQVQAILTRDDDGSAVDLTGSTTVMRFRKKGTTAVLFTLSNINTVAGDLTNGIAVFQFGAGNLNVDEGKYEGEVEATLSSGEVGTVFEILDFFVRADFD